MKVFDGCVKVIGWKVVSPLRMLESMGFLAQRGPGSPLYQHVPRRLAK
jgi:hypothetical protein